VPDLVHPTIHGQPEKHHRIAPGEINHLNIGGIGEENRSGEIRQEYSGACGFSSEVWRVFFGRYPAMFYGLDVYDHDIRPPREDEVPTQKWIAYGSSITSGAGATLHHGGYVYHAARRAHSIGGCHHGTIASTRTRHSVSLRVS
jgi:hypothetical protein